MILIVNAGSSSLKVALYRRRPRLEPDVTATIDRLDGRGGRWAIHVADRPDPQTGELNLASHAKARTAFLAWVQEHGYRDRIEALVTGWCMVDLPIPAPSRSTMP